MTKETCKPDELGERAARGDPKLLADLFNCFRTDLMDFLRRRCGNLGDADDALQDAFLAATRYLSAYRGETPLKSWLYRLAGSACTRMRRGRKNDPKLHCSYDDSTSTAAVDREREVESMIEARLSPLQGALDSLNATDRAVLMLRDGEQLSTREVAESLALSEAAVKSRLHRARTAVLKRLAG